MSIFRRFIGGSASNAAGYAIGSAIHPTLRPLTQKVVNETWPKFPFIPLTPEQAAAAVERGEMTYTEAQAEALLSGTNPQRFHVIERLAGLAPSTEQLLALRRRGAIDGGRLHEGLVQGNVRSEWAAELAQLSNQLLTVGELANMVVQGVVDQATATGLAATTGTSAENFDRLVQTAGSPIGGHELLDLWNRGEIDEGDVDRGLRQSHLKPEWVEPFKKLARYLPTVPDLVRFAVREVFSPDIRAKYGLDDDFPEVFAQRAAERGLSDEDARAYWAAHWELPSITQAQRMLWRGIIDQADFELILRTKDVMPFWRKALTDAAHLVPGRIDLRRFYATGIITEAQVFEGYKKLGYDEQTARWQTDFAVKGTGAAAKDLTAANLRAEYEGLFITRAEAIAGLTGLGYSAAEAAAYANLGDAARVKSARDTVLKAIHDAFVSHEVQAADARASLSDIGISAEAIDHLLPLWTAELSATRKRLTPAQIGAGYRRSTLSQADALRLLGDYGYSDAEARSILGLALPILTVRQIQDALKAARISYAQAVEELTKQGYTAQGVLELIGPEPAPAPTPPAV